MFRRYRDLSPERRWELRERYRHMTPEERQRLRDRLRQRTRRWTCAEIPHQDVNRAATPNSSSNSSHGENVKARVALGLTVAVAVPAGGARMPGQMDVELVNDSLERCPSQLEFFESFYRRFRGSSDAIAAKFHNTDSRAQSRALRDSFYVLLGAVGGDPAGWQQLELRALRHDRKHLDVSPWMYEVWLECLVETVSELDPEFDSATEFAWRRILQQGIDFMIARY